MFPSLADLPLKKNFANSSPSKFPVSLEPRFKYFMQCMDDQTQKLAKLVTTETQNASQTRASQKRRKSVRARNHAL